MRIALVTPLYAPFAGGVEQHVAMLAREMASRGHTVEILTTDPVGKLPAYEAGEQISIRRFRSYGRGAFRFAPRLSRWLARGASRYDVLHAHSYHQPLIVQAALVARRTPLVLTAHYHGVGHTPMARMMHWPYRPLGRWALHQARRIVCVSDVERTRLVRDFGQLPIVSIPNGVDVDALLATPAEHGQPVATRVLTVGRLEPYKQPMRILQCVPYLPSSCTVSFVGDGALRASLAHTAEQLGVADRVQVHGRLVDDAVRREYRSADVFVTLSLQEAFGLTLLEATVAGASVVASAIAPHQEVARFVPPGRIAFVPPDVSPADLASAIVAAAARGRLQADSSWQVPTWDTVARQTLDVYADCADVGIPEMAVR
jgi:glycosyltransferase involved in cell wall biosynthesis